MATLAAATTGQTPVQDTAPRKGIGRTSNPRPQVQDIAPPSGHPSARRAPNSARFVRTGYRSSIGAVRSLVKLHKDTSELFNQKQSKHVQELSQATLTALRDVKKPSIARHGLDIGLCVFVDTVVLVFLTALIVAGSFSAGVTTALGIAASILVAFIMWPTERIILGRSAKKNREQRKRLENDVERIKQDIENVKEEYKKFRKWARLAAQRYPQLAARVASTGSRISRSAKLIKPVGKLVSWLSKFLKNPAVKGTAESIPFVQIVPWWTVGAFASYIANRAEYKEAQQLLEQYRASKAEVFGVTGEMYETQLTVIEKELVEKTNEIEGAEIALAT